jgi:hypothetical protein
VNLRDLVPVGGQAGFRGENSRKFIAENTEKHRENYLEGIAALFVLILPFIFYLREKFIHGTISFCVCSLYF